MKLSWLIELIDMNTHRVLSDRVSEAGRSSIPQCILMGRVAYDDTKRAMMEYYQHMDPWKRDPDELRPPYRINGVPIFLDLGIPELGIRLLRNDGTGYFAEGTYRP